MRVQWTRPAHRDLEAIGDYLARDAPAAAARLVSRILSQVDRLATFPGIGRVGRVPDTRELVIVGTPFIVPYRVRDDVVEVLAVYHGARRWPEGFG